MENFVEKIRRNPKVSIISLILFLAVLISIIIIALSHKSYTQERSDSSDYYSSEYFIKSILRQIRIKEVPFETTIRVYDVSNENGKQKQDLMNVIKDFYDFKSGIGEQSLEYYENGKKIWTDNLLFHKIDEIYQINYDQKTCDSFDYQTGKSFFYFYLNNWMPKEVLNHLQEHVFFSPSYLLYFLFEEYRGYALDASILHAKCEKAEESEENNEENLVKCELINNETAKIVYYFNEKDGKTMYPKTMSIFKRKTPEENWNHYREIEYSDFKVHTNEKHIEHLNLPIGLGCLRKNEEAYRYFYGLESPFVPEFHFDYDLNFKYTDEKSKEIVFKKYSGSTHHFSLNSKLEINVNYGVNEETNKPMNTFYDRENKIFYDFYPKNSYDADIGTCERHSYANSNKINWFYFLDLFANKIGKFDFAGDNHIYSYLGEHTIDGRKSFAYEALLGDFNQLANEVYRLADQNGHSKNMNNISSDHMIATYYYPTSLEDGFDNYDILSMPFKMEFRLKAFNKDIEEEEGNMITLDIKKYKAYVFNNRLFNPFKNCIDKSLGYDQITINYTIQAKKLDEKIILESFIKDALRKKIDKLVTALRTNDFQVEFNETVGNTTEIYAKFKLFDPIDAELHFDIIEDEDFEYSEGDKNKIWEGYNEKQCAIECIQKENCGTYSYDKANLICKMFEIGSFNQVLEIYKGKINFSKYYNTTEKKGIKLAQKKQYFYCEKHCSNLDHLGIFGNKMKGNFLDLKILNGVEFITIKPTGLESKRIDGETSNN